MQPDNRIRWRANKYRFSNSGTELWVIHEPLLSDYPIIITGPRGWTFSRADAALLLQQARKAGNVTKFQRSTDATS